VSTPEHPRCPAWRVRCRAVLRAVACLAALLVSGCAGGEADESRGQPAPPTEAAPPTAAGPATSASTSFASTVRPFAETPELRAGSGDVADDIALHRSGHIIGTSKSERGGLEVYDRRARRLQWLALGATNNVDLRGDLVVSSNRTYERIDVLRFAGGRLRLLRSLPLPFEPYGICLFGRTVVVTAVDEGRVEQYSLTGRPLRRLSGIESQSEGCVADHARGVLYVAEEDRGIWRFAADPNGGRGGRLIDTVDGHLTADVEGLTLARGHLIASSQGDSQFAVYRRDRFVASFRVSGRGRIDGATDTDGIAASAALNLLVVHDNANSGGRSSNYKLIRLSDLFRR
jgi:3-phytase